MRLDGDQNVLVYANYDELEQRANELCLVRTSLEAKSMRLLNLKNVSGFVMCWNRVSKQPQSMMATRASEKLRLPRPSWARQSQEISGIRQFEVGSMTHVLSTVQGRCPIANCEERDRLCLELYILPRLS